MPTANKKTEQGDIMDVNSFICDICGISGPLDPKQELIESGILDSLAIIELLTALEDEDIVIHLTRIDRSRLKTVESIEALIEEYK